MERRCPVAACDADRRVWPRQTVNFGIQSIPEQVNKFSRPAVNRLLTGRRFGPSPWCRRTWHADSPVNRSSFAQICCHVCRRMIGLPENMITVDRAAGLVSPAGYFLEERRGYRRYAIENIISVPGVATPLGCLLDRVFALVGHPWSTDNRLLTEMTARVSLMHH